MPSDNTTRRTDPSNNINNESAEAAGLCQSLFSVRVVTVDPENQQQQQQQQLSSNTKNDTDETTTHHLHDTRQESIVETIFPPAPIKNDDEPRLLFDDENRSQKDAMNANDDLNQISSTEACILQASSENPIPQNTNDDGPHMLYESE